MSVQRRSIETPRPWVVRWREQGRHRARSFRTRREAVQFDAEVARQATLRDVPAFQPATMPLADWLETWIRVHGPTWAPSTRRDRAAQCDRWIEPYLGPVLLGQIGRRDVNRWRATILRDGASANTANHAMRVLSAALGTAVDEDLIAGNPCLGIRAMRHRVERPRALSEDEVSRLLDATANDRDRRMIALMAWAGLRPGEVIALRWEDIGDAVIDVSRSIRVDGSEGTPKSGRGRTVPISDRLRDLLGASSGQGLVCPRLDRPAPLQWRAWYRHQWLGIRERSAVECAPYGLRHTYASRRIAQGASVVDVAAAMGHSDPALTLRRYATCSSRPVMPPPRSRAPGGAVLPSRGPAGPRAPPRHHRGANLRSYTAGRRTESGPPRPYLGKSGHERRR